MAHIVTSEQKRKTVNTDMTEKQVSNMLDFILTITLFKLEVAFFNKLSAFLLNCDPPFVDIFLKFKEVGVPLETNKSMNEAR